MSTYTRLIRPWLFRCDAERVHDRAIRASHLAGMVPPFRGLLGRCYRVADPRLATEVAGLHFENPLGLAAGYDKNGRAVRMMAALGFGFVEIGSISADPSDGNPRPRLWRLPDDQAICVHYGLPNEGAEAVARRLNGQRWPVPLGVNVVKTNRGADALPDCDADVLDDYVRSVRLLADVGDYLCLNLSCPNTEMGRDYFADAANIVALLQAIGELNVRCPVFLKVSPLGGVEAIERVLEAADSFDFISGFVFNLPPGKPAGLRTDQSVWASLPGAVSGRPARAPLNDAIRELYRRMDRQRYHIIAAGGVFTAEDAYEKICLGALLVQLLTGIVYEGPGLVKRINRELSELLQREGFDCVAQAVGTAS